MRYCLLRCPCRNRAVDRRLLLRGRRRCERTLPAGRIRSNAGRAMVCRWPGGLSSQSVHARPRVNPPGRSLVFRRMVRSSRSTRGCRCATRSNFRRGIVHSEPPGNALLVPPGWAPGWAYRGGDQVRVASSIATLASRSACTFDSRRTCSKVTRPIWCASSRALACSG